MFARVLNLDTQSAPDAGFQDQDAIPDWAVGAVNAMAAAGYMQGSNGLFRPADTITRAEIVTILDNIFSANYNTSGEYTGDVDGSAVISADAVTLKDMHITGDLIVAEGVGEGHVELNNVTVDGRLLVRGGGENSIVIKGDSKITQVVVSRQDGKVRVAVEDSAQVSVVVVDQGTDSVMLEGELGTVSVEGAGAAVEITGQVDTVSVTEDAVGAVVTVAKGASVSTVTTAAEDAALTVAGTVEDVTVTEAAEGTSIKTESGAKIDSVTTSGSNTTVEGEGTVSKVEAAEGSTGTTVTTDGTKVENNSSESVTTGSGTVEAGESGTSGKPSTGGSTGGGTVDVPTVQELTGIVASQSGTDFTTIGEDFVLDLDNEIPAEVSDNFTQEQVSDLGGSGDYRSLTLYVKVNGEPPTFTSIQQNYVTADGQLAAMSNGKPNPKEWTFGDNKIAGEAGRYAVKDGQTYLKLSLYAFTRTGEDADWTRFNNVTQVVLNFYNGETLVATLTVDSPLNGYTVSAPVVVDDSIVNNVDELNTALANDEFSTVTIAEGASLELSSPLTVNKTLVVNGTLDASSVKLSGTGKIVVANGGTLKMNANYDNGSGLLPTISTIEVQHGGTLASKTTDGNETDTIFVGTGADARIQTSEGAVVTFGFAGSYDDDEHPTMTINGDVTIPTGQTWYSMFDSADEAIGIDMTLESGTLTVDGTLKIASANSTGSTLTVDPRTNVIVNGVMSIAKKGTVFNNGTITKNEGCTVNGDLGGAVVDNTTSTIVP